jgi:hypothetical protein
MMGYYLGPCSTFGIIILSVYSFYDIPKHRSSMIQLYPQNIPYLVRWFSQLETSIYIPAMELATPKGKLFKYHENPPILASEKFHSTPSWMSFKSPLNPH